MSSRTGGAPVSSWRGDSPEPCFLSCRQCQRMEKERQRVEGPRPESRPVAWEGLAVEKAQDRAPRRRGVMTFRLPSAWPAPTTVLGST